MCYINPKKCIICTRSCNSDEFKNVDNCICESCRTKYNDSHCSRCNSQRCLQCDQGYYLDNNNKCTICPQGTYSNQGASSCITCPSGYYSNQGAASCTKCSTKYPNCKTCNNTQCIECETNYKLSDDKQKCEKRCPNKTIEIDAGGKKLCVTQYNMGDQPEFPLTGVSVVSVNSKCSGSACCWQGRTAEGCDSANGGYSGCNRTVCTHYAAQVICTNLSYDNRSWRLPTKDELAVFNSYSKDKGISGLMLCDSSSNHGSARCGHNISNCQGADRNYCNPCRMWASGGSDYSLHTGSWVQGGVVWHTAQSVRCVSEL